MQEVHFDKITARISRLAYGLNTDFCDPVRRETMQLLELSLHQTSIPCFYLNMKAISEALEAVRSLS